MTYPTNCPHCDHFLDRGDIYEVLKEIYGEDKAKEWAPHYGWSIENPQRFSNILSVYDLEKDRTTHHMCPECKKTIEV